MKVASNKMYKIKQAQNSNEKQKTWKFKKLYYIFQLNLKFKWLIIISNYQKSCIIGAYHINQQKCSNKYGKKFK